MWQGWSLWGGLRENLGGELMGLRDGEHGVPEEPSPCSLRLDRYGSCWSPTRPPSHHSPYEAHPRLALPRCTQLPRMSPCSLQPNKYETVPVCLLPFSPPLLILPDDGFFLAHLCPWVLPSYISHSPWGLSPSGVSDQ